jgi:hypothetical protein
LILNYATPVTSATPGTDASSTNNPIKPQKEPAMNETPDRNHKTLANVNVSNLGLFIMVTLVVFVAIIVLASI